MKAVLFGLAAVANGQGSLDSVITALATLRDDVKADGTAEATAYDTFACNCRDNTEEKSGEINGLIETINLEAAHIKEKTSELNAERKALQDNLNLQESLKKELLETNNEWTVTIGEILADERDAEWMKDALASAIENIAAAQTSGDYDAAATTFLQSANGKAIMAKYKKQVVDPEPPVIADRDAASTADASSLNRADAVFQSGNILDVLGDIKTSVENQLTRIRDRETTARTGFENFMEAQNTKLSDVQGDLEGNRDQIILLKGEIGEHKVELGTAQNSLTDAQTYLKELTNVCEEKARSWDERSATRAEEVHAITVALGILEGGVTDAKTGMGEAETEKGNIQTRKEAGAGDYDALITKSKKITVVPKIHEAKAAAVTSFLQRSEGSALRSQLEAALVKGDQVVVGSILRLLKSQADPFVKVKTMVQNLISKLEDEATKETAFLSWCTTTMEAAKQQAEQSRKDIEQFSAAMGEASSEFDSLSLQIYDLEEENKQQEHDMQFASDIRRDNKEQNMKALKNAKDGAAAVSNAIKVLQKFYNKAAGKTFRESAKGVDDVDSPFAGAHQGDQEGGNHVIGLMETLLAEFKTSIKEISDQEKEEQDNFIDLHREGAKTVSGNEANIKIKKGEAASEQKSYHENLKNLQDEMSLLDDHVATLSDARPRCKSLGMSHEETKKNRENTIAALKDALKLLQDISGRHSK